MLAPTDRSFRRMFSMAGFVLALLLSVVGGASRIADARCDMVEINHYAPTCGNGFVQLIAWDWCPQYRRWHAQQWLILAEWDMVGNTVRCVGDGVEVIVAGRFVRETWTTVDPERENQVLFPSDLRRKVW